jgi:superfamily II DNA or RNA helicase
VSDINLTQIDQVFFRVEAEPSILAEMSDAFTFKVPNAHFMPTYKMKIWDGRIRFLNRINNTIYCGLIKHIEKFANDREYTIEYNWLTTKIDDNDLKEYIQSLQLPFELRDYQFNCFKRGLEQRKTLFISPTASGKSSVIYLLTKHFIDKDSRKALVIVPTLNLISQMTNDFITYAKKYDETREFKTESLIHQIYSGQDKNTNKQIIISTWQSLHRLPATFFQQFGFVLVDECHMAKANSIKNILVKCTGANWRFGTTGTLNGAQSDSMLIEGLTGPVFQATTTKQLMDTNKLAKLKINCIVLKHTEEDCQTVRKLKYADEIGMIIANEKRNKFIRNLTISQKGNTLVLFQYVAKHGKLLHEMISQKVNSVRKVFFIYGGTEMEDREKVREITELETDAIIVASVGVFSTGVNIKNLDNIIFASPSKSRIRVLQSIGRVLRIGRSDKATLYDIVDDMQYKKHRNFVLKHFIERAKIYDAEDFDYNIYQIPL